MAGLIQPLLMPGVRLDRDARSEAARALERARLPWVMGFCLFGGDVETVAALTARLEDAAGRSLRFASDMERGGGQQVRGLPTHPPLGVLGRVARPEEVRDVARAAAADARSVGIDVLFAPVLDVRSEPRNPIVGARSFGEDAGLVARLGAAFCEGARAGGAFPVGKHWPGHGATTEDSHDACPRVDEPAARLRERDLAPFVAAAAAGCRAFMTAHVRYPTLDPSGVVATFSRLLVDEARALGDTEQPLLLVTDALLMAGALGPGVDETEAARRALEAGADVLLYPEDPERVAAALFHVAPARASVLHRAAADATARIARTWGRRLPAAPRRDMAALADDLAARAVRAAGIGASAAREVVLVDDDGTTAAPAHGAELARCLTDAGRRVTRVHPREEAAVTAPAGSVLVVLAEVRAWKGASGISPETRGWLLAQGAGHEQVALAPAPLPGARTVIGTGPELERALAGALLGG